MKRGQHPCDLKQKENFSRLVMTISRRSYYQSPVFKRVEDIVSVAGGIGLSAPTEYSIARWPYHQGDR